MRLGLLETMRLVTAMTAAAMVAACSGGQDNSIEPTPTIEITLTPTTATVVQGGNTTANLMLTRAGGFTGEVAVAFEGLPAGVTPAAAPATLGSSVTSSVLTFTASATAATGTANVTVRATGTGVMAKTATIALTVTAPPGGFTLALQPTALTVQQGTSGNTTVTITRTNGFAGPVNLTATGLPNGVTAAFDPAAATANTSTLTLAASGTATVGQATVTVRGNATGLTEQTATLTLNITAATGDSGNTTWEFCTASQTPLWLAIQDGATGTWTRVTATGTKFQFNIAQAKGGVAFLTGTTTSGNVASTGTSLAERLAATIQRELLLRNRTIGTRATAYASRSMVDGFALSIFYGTQTELNARGTTRCLPGMGKTLTGTVAGLAPQQTANISLGPSSESVSNPGTTYQLTDVPDGPLDLVASRTTSAINGTSFDFTLDELIIRRALNFANNATIPVLDFSAAEAFDPAQANITIGNPNGELGYAITSFFTASGSGVLGATLIAEGLPGAGPFKYYGIPTARQIAGDLHLATAFAFPSLTTTDQFRFVGLYFKDPTDRTVTLGPALTAPTVSTAATTPYVRFRATAPIQTQYNKFVQAMLTQNTIAREVNIFASEGYLSGATSYDFTVPDFSGVAGWDNNWGPKTGAATTWTVLGISFTGTGFGANNPLEGATVQGAARTGSITP